MIELNHLDDVLPSVEGRRDFVVARKDGYTVVDYVYAGPDTFDDTILKACRSGPDCAAMLNALGARRWYA